MTETLPTETVSTTHTKPLPRGGLTWFEVATTDIDRAATFYRTILGAPLIDVSHDEPMFMFPAFDGEVTGALVQRPGQTPSVHGTMVYLRIAGFLVDAMERVEPAGGKRITGAMVVPNAAGTFCVIQDSEGNRVGLHAKR